jgi:hypothetical protein
MFANIVKFRAASVAQIAPRPVALAHSNDNTKAVRAAAVALHRRERPILACHWRSTTGGGLECHWEVERANGAATEEPDQRSTAVCGLFGFAHAA